MLSLMGRDGLLLLVKVGRMVVWVRASLEGRKDIVIVVDLDFPLVFFLNFFHYQILYKSAKQLQLLLRQIFLF
jgi:hypothetical protein